MGEGGGGEGAGLGLGVAHVTPPGSASPIMAAACSFPAPGLIPAGEAGEGPSLVLKKTSSWPSFSPFQAFPSLPLFQPLGADALVIRGGLFGAGSLPWPEDCLGPRPWALPPGEQGRFGGGGHNALVPCVPQGVVRRDLRPGWGVSFIFLASS